MTKSCFFDAGSLPLWKDALHKAARIGENCVADCLRAKLESDRVDNVLSAPWTVALVLCQWSQAGTRRTYWTGAG